MNEPAKIQGTMPDTEESSNFLTYLLQGMD
jgi:hypothetical protein